MLLQRIAQSGIACKIGWRFSLSEAIIWGSFLVLGSTSYWEKPMQIIISAITEFVKKLKNEVFIFVLGLLSVP